jgi:hypothetical protein
MFRAASDARQPVPAVRLTGWASHAVSDAARNQFVSSFSLFCPVNTEPGDRATFSSLPSLS